MSYIFKTLVATLPKIKVEIWGRSRELGSWVCKKSMTMDEWLASRELAPSALKEKDLRGFAKDKWILWEGKALLPTPITKISLKTLISRNVRP